MSNKILFTSLAEDLMKVVRGSIVELANDCGGKDKCSNPNCMYHTVQRHKDPTQNPYLDLCYTSTLTLYHLIEMLSPLSGGEFDRWVKLRRKDGPTGRRNAKGPVKHFWLDIDGEIFDPSYPQYVIGKTLLPTYENWDNYKKTKHTLKPERVSPLLERSLLNLVGG